MSAQPFDPRKGSLSDKTRPSPAYVPVTPGSSGLANGPCRGILCNEDGALNLTDMTDTVRVNVPVFKGVTPLAAKVIDNPSSGSAPGTIFALY